ncbi:MAG: hypothetical protein RLZZ299_663 [Pseudomonadota bacterium]|jgi:spore maturation protein SpmA
MNLVFYGLVALSVLFAAWRGTPEHPVVSGEPIVQLDWDSPVKAGSDVVVEVGDARCTARVGSVDAAHRATLDLSDCALPDGPRVASFPEEYAPSRMSRGALEGAKSSVDVAIGLAGAMTLFLGLVKVLEAAGAMDVLARIIRPLMVRLFPDVPPDHPAMGAMILNIAANVLGLGNAATPFGIRAMQALETLNRVPGVATNAMIRFLAINTSGVAVLPTGVIAMRAAAGSRDPAAIFLTTLLATSASTVSAILTCIVLERFSKMPSPGAEEGHPSSATPPPAPASDDAPEMVVEPVAAGETGWRALLPLAGVAGALLALVVAVYRLGETASAWIVPGLVFGMLTAGVVKGVKVYETFLEGARDGFQSAIRIVPYLVAVLAAVGMFRGSGGLGLLVSWLAPVCRAVGMPPEALPLALLRPLSGSGAFALTADLTRTYGPDSLIGQVAGTLQGSTETTFYVLAVYFGAVGVTRARHAVAAGLVADVMGAVGTLVAVHFLLR